MFFFVFLMFFHNFTSSPMMTMMKEKNLYCKKSSSDFSNIDFVWPRALVSSKELLKFNNR